MITGVVEVDEELEDVDVDEELVEVDEELEDVEVEEDDVVVGTTLWIWLVRVITGVLEVDEELADVVGTTLWI